MKIVKSKFFKQTFIPEYLNNNYSFAFIDIETDGLNHYKNRIVLIGINIIKEDKNQIIQLFSDKATDTDELSILTEFNSILKNIDVLYSYNGLSFDFPFLLKKFKKYSLCNELSKKIHIDLIKVIRKNKKKLDLENCKLKTIEKHIGIKREDSISGKDSVLLFKEYLKTNSPAIEKTILKHNYDDILYLPSILKFENSLRDEKNKLISINKDMLFIIEIESLSLFENKVNLKGNIKVPKLDYILYEQNYNLNIDSKNNIFTLDIFLKDCKLNSNISGKYINLENDNLMNFNLIKTKNDFEFDLPQNILLLKKDGVLIFENLKRIVKVIFEKNL